MQKMKPTSTTSGSSRRHKEIRLLWYLACASCLARCCSQCDAFIVKQSTSIRRIQSGPLASWSGASGNYLDALTGNEAPYNTINDSNSKNNGHGSVQVQTPPTAISSSDTELSFDEWYNRHYSRSDREPEESPVLMQQLEQAVEQFEQLQEPALQPTQPVSQSTLPQKPHQQQPKATSFASAYDAQYAVAMAAASSPPAPTTSATQETAINVQQPSNTGAPAARDVPQQQQEGAITEKNLSPEDEYLKMVSSEVGVKLLNNQNPYAITDIPISVMIQRFLDNLEDATQKNNGKTKGKSRLKGKAEPSADRPTVIVLGTGWAAHAFIKLASTYDLRIVVVSPVNHFVFTPMLASAAVGTVEYRSMTEPIRVTNPLIDNYVEGRAIGVDVPNKLLTVQLTALSTVTGAFKGIASQAPCRLQPEPLPADAKEMPGAGSDAARVIELNYDYLVCAVGTSVRSTIVPGAKEHCFNLKTSQDSKRLRTAIGEALEYASRPDVQESYYSDATEQLLARDERRRRVRFVLVGGGPTGVELAGELMDFFGQVCRKPDGAFQHLAEDISVILVHGGNEVLPAMDIELRQRAMASLQAQGVELRLNTRLQDVGRDYVKLQEKGSDVIDSIGVGLTCWCAGNAPVPFVKELLSQLPESAAGSAGRINIDGWLRCPTPTPESFGSILVLGDVACRETQSKLFPASTLPQTAQVAGQQGSYAARMLNRGYNLQTTPPRLPEEVDEFSFLRIWLLARGLNEAPPFNFLSLGLMAYIGGGEALNQVQLGDVPIFNYAGRVAFFLWQTVYLSKQAATRNQALIAFDWLRTGAFGRDITRL